MGTAPARLTGRQHMGGGEFLTPAPSPYAFRVDCPEPKPHWRARDPGDQIRPAFAGTPVVVAGELYEVVEHREPLAADAEGAGDHGGSNQHVYLLSPWDDRHPLRGPTFEYSVEALRAERRDCALAEQDAKLGARLNLLGILTALLPARDQEHLARAYGFEAVFWTRWSAFAWTILWFGAAIVLMGYFPWTTGELVALMVCVAFLVEQFLRRGKAIVGEPCGSMLGVAVRRLLPRHLRATHDA